jgi:hypothetical protein
MRMTAAGRTNTGLSAALLALAALLSLAPSASADSMEEIEFYPPDTVQWGLRNVAAGATSIFGMWSYWYSNIKVEVETVPADALVELFYIRANFQKNFTRVVPPVRVILPPRIKTTHRDALIVRVAAPGHKGREETYDVQALSDKILITLKPLPNSLTFLGHTHLAGRSTLTLRTTKEAQFRVMKTAGSKGFTLALAETAEQLEEPAVLSGGLLDSVNVAQVGEDLLLKVETLNGDVEVRSKTRYDPIRKEHVFLLDLMPPGARAPGFDEVRRELDLVPVPPRDECRALYEAKLRELIDPEMIARAHRPSGSIADLYRREAMKRVGRVDQGTVHTVGGEAMRTGNPLELELALQSAASVEGYLAFLGEYARRQEEPEITLRSLLAPELAAPRFAEIYRELESVRGSCL